MHIFRHLPAKAARYLWRVVGCIFLPHTRLAHVCTTVQGLMTASSICNAPDGGTIPVCYWHLAVATHKTSIILNDLSFFQSFFHRTCKRDGKRSSTGCRLSSSTGGATGIVDQHHHADRIVVSASASRVANV